jgi:methionine-rich copper-binding protein CopC
MPPTSRRPHLVLACLLLAVVAPIGLVASAAPAGAHASVSATEPKADARVTALPKRIVIHVIKKQATRAGDPIQVFDPDGVRIDSGDVVISDGGSVISVGLQSGARRSGIYNVLYQITSADTHIIHDRFSFSLTPLSNEPAAAAADGAVRNGPAPALAVTNSRLRVVGPPGGSVLAAAFVLIALIALLVMITRRRRHRHHPEADAHPGFRVLSSGEHRLGPIPGPTGEHRLGPVPGPTGEHRLGRGPGTPAVTARSDWSTSNGAPAKRTTGAF